MLDIDYVLYKIETINSTINSTIRSTINSTMSYIMDNLFTKNEKEDEGYTIVTKKTIKYVSYKELWDDTD